MLTVITGDNPNSHLRPPEYFIFVFIKFFFQVLALQNKENNNSNWNPSKTILLFPLSKKVEFG